jgi:hypothetical protein
MQDMRELALEAVQERRNDNPSGFSAIAVELEMTLGRRAARRLIDAAESELNNVPWLMHGLVNI